MGYRPPFLDVIQYPFTLLVIVVNIYICFHLNRRHVPIDHVAISATRFLDNREYWRCVTASFSHYSIIHIIFNVSSAWQLRVVEEIYGAVKYFKLISILVVLPPILDSLIRKRFFPTRIPWAVGYSCVLCGLSACLSLLGSSFSFFGISIPWSFMPFIQVVITQLLVPQASFIGHMSGVVTGFAISWHLFDWYTEKLFLHSLPWIIFFFFHSYKRSHNDRFGWYKFSLHRRI